MNSGMTAVAPSSAASSAGLSCRRRPLRNQTTVLPPICGAAWQAQLDTWMTRFQRLRASTEQRSVASLTVDGGDEDDSDQARR